ncbi:MAG TPA: VCBS repeat-containing protein [Pirellulaceae bacterium]|nr:VCBS repeat-containing protein [Pirellulaceae bacterium]
MRPFLAGIAPAVFLCAWCGSLLPLAAEDAWRKHTVYTGAHCNTAVAADFTGDKLVDVICNAGGVTRLLVAPDWTEVILDADSKLGLIHGETMDVDRDGDPDFIGARYSPGLIFWLERPANALQDRWTYHLIDDQVDGIHGLLAGDVDGDGQPDLLANSAQPVGPFANSLVWYRPPANAAEAKQWPRKVLANGDAPGLSHYLGIGDVNGDGRPDAASAAKGGPQDTGGLGEWFAWWEAPLDPTSVWKKHLIADQQPGATNIHPADVNGDGRMDFVASRGHGHGLVWFEAPTWKVHNIQTTFEGPHCLAVIDLDGDGDIDAATCAKDDRVVAWFENDGKGNFTTHIIDTDQAAYDIRAIDMDGDGDVDLLIAGQLSQNVVWYENPTKRNEVE